MPLQYSCLENSMDRGAWQAQESDTTEHTHTHTHTLGTAGCSRQDPAGGICFKIMSV